MIGRAIRLTSRHDEEGIDQIALRPYPPTITTIKYFVNTRTDPEQTNAWRCSSIPFHTCVPVRSPPLRHPVGLERHGQLLFVGEGRQGEPPEVDHRHGDHDKLSPYATVPGGKAEWSRGNILADL